MHNNTSPSQHGTHTTSPSRTYQARRGPGPGVLPRCTQVDSGVGGSRWTDGPSRAVRTQKQGREGVKNGSAETGPQESPPIWGSGSVRKARVVDSLTLTPADGAQPSSLPHPHTPVAWKEWLEGVHMELSGHTAHSTQHTANTTPPVGRTSFRCKWERSGPGWNQRSLQGSPCR